MSVQPSAANALHHVEEPPVWQCSHVVDRDNAGVFELGENSSLAKKAVCALDRGPGLGEYFERYLASQLHIPREVHNAHATSTDLFHQLITSASQIRRTRHLPQVRYGRVG